MRGLLQVEDVKLGSFNKVASTAPDSPSVAPISSVTTAVDLFSLLSAETVDHYASRTSSSDTPSSTISPIVYPLHAAVLPSTSAQLDTQAVPPTDPSVVALVTIPKCIPKLGPRNKHACSLNNVSVKALFDSGCPTSFITEALVNPIGLRTQFLHSVGKVPSMAWYRLPPLLLGVI